jgi:hypothetical protein
MEGKSMDELMNAFYLMWESFPGTARLIRKDRTILASNAFAKRVGFVPDVKCVMVGSPEIHKGCRVNEMFRTGSYQVVKSENGTLRYWLPVPGHDDVYVHVTFNPNSIEGMVLFPTPIEKKAVE